MIEGGKAVNSGLTIWITGLSGAGKSTVAEALAKALTASGRPTYVLDGDTLRAGLNSDLGFSASDRAQSVRRAGEVALLLADAGMVAIAALISPCGADRAQVRARHAAAGRPFVEVFMDTPLDVCESRDLKGLYARARAGTLANFTGVSAPYDIPVTPEICCRTCDRAPGDVAQEILEYVDARHSSRFAAANGN